MSCSLTPPRSNHGSVEEEDTDSTGGIGVGDAATGKLSATKVPISLAPAGSSSINVPSSIPCATGAISGPSTDSSSERSITRIGSLSGTISLREYDDDDDYDDDDVVLLGSSTRMRSLYVRCESSIDCRFDSIPAQDHLL
ncbi:hypothetical protein M9H77_07303 [Catharanthus roseus]|uniref:Uncharacterized protein n=1 Tax=Catharanthus roseus TaxID=4058 RepID=A0ACC0BUU4_CATRO|nr:hypothetical protein M9H77_07303 [Catharanthus roseus]